MQAGGVHRGPFTSISVLHRRLVCVSELSFPHRRFLFICRQSIPIAVSRFCTVTAAAAMAPTQATLGYVKPTQMTIGFVGSG